METNTVMDRAVCRIGALFSRCRFTRGAVTLAGLALGVFIGLVLAPILPPIPKAEATTSTAGSTAGAFDVSDSGAATYTIPIAVPPGVRGMQPSLALTYNSQNRENGLLGLGWSLSGLSVVHRCGATIHIDGFKGGVNYDANDRFCLNGERLIAIGGNEYRTEHESWQKVSAWGGTTTNPSYFTVSAPDGTTREYGRTTDSRIEAQGQSIVRVWALSGVKDKRSNCWVVSYQESSTDSANGDYRPGRIDYSGRVSGSSCVNTTNSVQFGYEDRTDLMTRYEGGALQRVMQRLTTVTTTTDATSYNPANAKQYVLAYDNGASVGKSRLKSITECGFDLAAPTTPVCMSPTQIVWQTFAGGYTNSPYSGHGISQSVEFVDLTGDGKADYVTADSAGNHKVGISSGAGYSSNPTWTGASFSTDGAYVDLNGDGRADYLRLTRANSYWQNYSASLSTGSGFTNVSWNNGPGVYATNGGVNYAFGDFNGDGRQDLFGTWNVGGIAGNTTDKYFIGFSVGIGVSQVGFSGMLNYGTGTWPCTVPDYSQNNRADLNCDGTVDSPDAPVAFDYSGDGRSDLEFKNYVSPQYVMKMNSTSAYTELVHAVTLPYMGERPRSAGDINGDGKDELAWTGCGTESCVGGIYFSTGTGLVNVAWPGGTTNLQFADMNGDGQNEVISVSGATHTVYFWTGSAFSSATWTGYGPSDSGTDFADMNGDGCADFVTVSTGGTHYWSKTNCTPDLVATIADVRNKVVITYKPLTDSSVYTRYADAIYPVKDVQDATYVVANHKTWSYGSGNGLNTWWYSYAGLKYHHEAAHSLGFAQMEVTGPDNIKQRTQFNQTLELAGQVNSTDMLVSDISRKNEIFSREAVRLDTGLSRGQVGYGRVLPRLTQTYGTGSDPATGASFGSTTTTYSSWDTDFPNFPKRVVTTTSDNYTTTTDTTFFHDTSSWILGLPTSKSVTAAWGGVTSSPRTVNYSYGYGGATCASGIHTSPLPGELTAETVQQGATADLVLTTSYGYDVNGNRCAASVTGWDGTATVTRTTRSAFGWSGRFMGWTQNALGHVAYVDSYDTRFGAPTEARDINGLKTTAEYDGFGRKISETKFAGTASPVTTTINYFYSGELTSMQTVTPGAGETWVYKDRFGRTYMTRTQGLWGAWVRKGTIYDRFGRVSSESLSYYETELPRNITYTYDELHRPSIVARPVDANGAGCAVTTTYDGLTVTVTNCKAQSVKTTKYVTGWVKSTEDGGGTVTNEYDPFGNLTKVTDPLNNQSTMGYDIRSRKTSMTDPDMGSWTYGYNAFGELISQTDAKAQVTTMTYDVLGRMKTRVRSEGTTTWTYDSGAKALGKFSSVTSPGYSESRGYDSVRGLPTTVTQTINGANYTTTTAYDSLARPTHLTYPTGFKIENRYDDYGHLAEVWSNSLATPVQYWKANVADATGAVTNEALGNGLTNTFDYDPGTGRLQTMDTKNASGTTLRNLSFGWDPVGNLTGRTWYDGTANRTETFAYDTTDGRKLNRLSVVSGPYYPAAKSYYYDAIGNITKKSDVGNYAYTGCGGRPHAVCSTSGGAVTTSFTYDANGNMLTGNGRTQTWTSFNKVKTVTKGSTTSTFTYGADDSRVSKVTGASTTHYVGKLYERYMVYSLATDRHYIHAGGNLVAIYNKFGSTISTRYYHQDHLGSVDAISDEAGTITARLSYDAWGRRRNPDGTDTTTPTTSTRGFTKHEHDDEVGLINMNAREYDPVIGRFISADPVLDNGVPSQALNRYTYAGNNPLSAIDPTGHGWFKKWKKRLRKWVRKYSEITIKNYVAGAYAAAGFVTGGPAGAVAGAYMGYNSMRAYEKGMPTDDILRGNARGFAAMYVGSGEWTGANAAWFEKAVVGGVQGGVTAEVGGGRFADGLKTQFGFSLANAGWEAARDVTDSLKLKSCAARPDSCNVKYPRNRWGELSTAGTRAPPIGQEYQPSGNWLVDFLATAGMNNEGTQDWNNTYYGRFVNAVGKVHDALNFPLGYQLDTGLRVPRSSTYEVLGNLYSFAGMLPAAAFTAGALSAPFVPAYLAVGNLE